ncbi:uncharacterized protein ACBR49_010239 [Aulostomus maculatus]
MKTLQHCQCATGIFICVIVTLESTATLIKGSEECNLTKLRDDRLCFGTVGQPLIFHLPDSADKMITLTKDGQQVILKISKKKKRIYHYHGKYTNPEFKLENVTKILSGNYSMEVFAMNGTSMKKVSFTLKVQAPLSAPAVSQTCLSPEQMKLTCSSEGDEVQFTLSLDGYELMQTRDDKPSQRNWTQNLIGIGDKQDGGWVSNVSIRLHGQQTGDIKCHVQNKVSRSETVVHLKSCEEFLFPRPAVAVISSAVTLLLVVLGFGLKHIYKKTRPASVTESNFDNVIYSDVVVRKKSRKTSSNTQDTR